MIFLVMVLQLLLNLNMANHNTDRSSNSTSTRALITENSYNTPEFRVSETLVTASEKTSSQDRKKSVNCEALVLRYVQKLRTYITINTIEVCGQDSIRDCVNPEVLETLIRSNPDMFSISKANDLDYVGNFTLNPVVFEPLSPSNSHAEIISLSKDVIEDQNCKNGEGTVLKFLRERLRVVESCGGKATLRGFIRSATLLLEMRVHPKSTNPEFVKEFVARHPDMLVVSELSAITQLQELLNNSFSEIIPDVITDAFVLNLMKQLLKLRGEVPFETLPRSTGKLLIAMYSREKVEKYTEAEVITDLIHSHPNIFEISVSGNVILVQSGLEKNQICLRDFFHYNIEDVVLAFLKLRVRRAGEIPLKTISRGSGGLLLEFFGPDKIGEFKKAGEIKKCILSHPEIFSFSELTGNITLTENSNGNSIELIQSPKRKTCNLTPIPLLSSQLQECNSIITEDVVVEFYKQRIKENYKGIALMKNLHGCVQGLVEKYGRERTGPYTKQEAIKNIICGHPEVFTISPDGCTVTLTKNTNATEKISAQHQLDNLGPNKKETNNQEMLITSVKALRDFISINLIEEYGLDIIKKHTNPDVLQTTILDHPDIFSISKEEDISLVKNVDLTLRSSEGIENRVLFILSKRLGFVQSWGGKITVNGLIRSMSLLVEMSANPESTNPNFVNQFINANPEVLALCELASLPPIQSVNTASENNKDLISDEIVLQFIKQRLIANEGEMPFKKLVDNTGILMAFTYGGRKVGSFVKPEVIRNFILSHSDVFHCTEIGNVRLLQRDTDKNEIKEICQGSTSEEIVLNFLKLRVRSRGGEMSLKTLSLNETLLLELFCRKIFEKFANPEKAKKLILNHPEIFSYSELTGNVTLTENGSSQSSKLSVDVVENSKPSSKVSSVSPCQNKIAQELISFITEDKVVEFCKQRIEKKYQGKALMQTLCDTCAQSLVGKYGHKRTGNLKNHDVIRNIICHHSEIFTVSPDGCTVTMTTEISTNGTVVDSSAGKSTTSPNLPKQNYLWPNVKTVNHEVLLKYLQALREYIRVDLIEAYGFVKTGNHVIPHVLERLIHSFPETFSVSIDGYVVLAENYDKSVRSCEDIIEGKILFILKERLRVAQEWGGRVTVEQLTNSVLLLVKMTAISESTNTDFVKGYIVNHPAVLLVSELPAIPLFQRDLDKIRLGGNIPDLISEEVVMNFIKRRLQVNNGQLPFQVLMDNNSGSILSEMYGREKVGNYTKSEVIRKIIYDNPSVFNCSVNGNVILLANSTSEQNDIFQGNCAEEIVLNFFKQRVLWRGGEISLKTLSNSGSLLVHLCGRDKIGNYTMVDKAKKLILGHPEIFSFCELTENITLVQDATTTSHSYVPSSLVNTSVSLVSSTSGEHSITTDLPSVPSSEMKTSSSTSISVSFLSSDRTNTTSLSSTSLRSVSSSYSEFQEFQALITEDVVVAFFKHCIAEKYRGTALIRNLYCCANKDLVAKYGFDRTGYYTQPDVVKDLIYSHPEVFTVSPGGILVTLTENANGSNATESGDFTTLHHLGSGDSQISTTQIHLNSQVKEMQGDAEIVIAYYKQLVQGKREINLKNLVGYSSILIAKYGRDRIGCYRKSDCIIELIRNQPEIFSVSPSGNVSLAVPPAIQQAKSTASIPNSSKTERKVESLVVPVIDQVKAAASMSDSSKAEREVESLVTPSIHQVNKAVPIPDSLTAAGAKEIEEQVNQVEVKICGKGRITSLVPEIGVMRSMIDGHFIGISFTKDVSPSSVAHLDLTVWLRVNELLEYEAIYKKQLGWVAMKINSVQVQHS